MATWEAQVVADRYLRGRLRAAREGGKLTQEQVAASLDWSPSKVVRIEAGTVGLSVTDLRALLGLYGITGDTEVAKLVDAARVAKRPWQKDYPGALAAGFDVYLSYESTASEIKTFQTLTVPGLLQTEEYARAILAANQAPDPDQRLEARMRRQELLAHAEGPALICVIDEAALHRQVGGPLTMRDQLVRLRAETGGTGRTSVEVIPYAAGAYVSMIESFTVLHSASWDEDVLSREGVASTVTDSEDHDLIGRYRARFAALREVALRGAAAVTLIDGVISELRDAASPRAEQQG
jgi:transcriptional regulator with XRE-family HTH domain